MYRYLNKWTYTVHYTIIIEQTAVVVSQWLRENQSDHNIRKKAYPKLRLVSTIDLVLFGYAWFQSHFKHACSARFFNGETK